MSYCVEYDPQMKKRYPSLPRKERKLTIRHILVFLMIAVAVYSVAKGDLVQYLIPGDPQITTAAFSGLMEQVGTGEPIGEAVFCFFKEVIVKGA